MNITACQIGSHHYQPLPTPFSVPQTKIRRILLVVIYIHTCIQCICKGKGKETSVAARLTVNPLVATYANCRASGMKVVSNWNCRKTIISNPEMTAASSVTAWSCSCLSSWWHSLCVEYFPPIQCTYNSMACIVDTVLVQTCFQIPQAKLLSSYIPLKCPQMHLGFIVWVDTAMLEVQSSMSYCSKGSLHPPE